MCHVRDRVFSRGLSQSSQSRTRLQANADLQKVAHEKVASMRAERDALAAEVAAARRQLAERQDDSEQVSRKRTAVALVANPQRCTYSAQQIRSSGQTAGSGKGRMCKREGDAGTPKHTF